MDPQLTIGFKTKIVIHDLDHLVPRWVGISIDHLPFRCGSCRVAFYSVCATRHTPRSFLTKDLDRWVSKLKIHEPPKWHSVSLTQNHPQLLDGFSISKFHDLNPPPRSVNAKGQGSNGTDATQSGATFGRSGNDHFLSRPNPLSQQGRLAVWKKCCC